MNLISTRAKWCASIAAHQSTCLSKNTFRKKCKRTVNDCRTLVQAEEAFRAPCEKENEKGISVLM